MAVDTGYQTERGYQFCRHHRGVAIATKGHDTLDKPFYKSLIEVNVRGQLLKSGLSLWHFNTDQAKSFIHARIEWPLDQPGGWWLPEDVSEDYCQQLVSEARTVNAQGKAVWVRLKKDNHYLDAEALAYVAVRILSSGREGVLEKGGLLHPEPRRGGMISWGLRPGETRIRGNGRCVIHPGIRIGHDDEDDDDF